MSKDEMRYVRPAQIPLEIKIIAVIVLLILAGFVGLVGFLLFKDILLIYSKFF